MLGRAVSLNVGGQLAGFAVSFVSAIMLARFLGPSDRGLLAIMVTAATVSVGLAGAGLATSAQYFASRKGTSQAALLGNTLAFGLVLGIVFVPLFWLLSGRLSAWLGHGHGGLLWVLAGVLVPLVFLDMTSAGQLCGQLRFGLWNGLLVAARTVTLFAVAVLVGVLALGVGGALVATGLGSVLVIAVSSATVLRRGRPRLDRRLFADELRYGAKAQVGQLFQFLNYRLDLVMLTLFGSLSAVGYYAVAQTLAELVIYLGTAFQISLLPLISQLEGDARQHETSRAAVRHHSVLALVVIAVNAVFVPLVLLVGYGPEFRPALVPVFILLPAMWFLGTGNLISGDLRGRGRPGLASAVKGAAAVVTVILDFALIPVLGVVGAAIASTVAYAFFGLGSLVVLSRVSGVPVRELVVPSRADLALYPRGARSLVARLRRPSGGPVAAAS